MRSNKGEGFLRFSNIFDGQRGGLFQPSLRDCIGFSLCPSAEALGYFLASLWGLDCLFHRI
jgi:hypothetical protein